MARLLALREGDADDRPVPSARLQSSAVRTALEEALTPLYVKTLVHAAKSAAWRAR